MTAKEEYMRRCLELARKGRGNVSPNPMVGCVIVKNGRVIGEGYHQKFGEAHAEVNAIRSASESVEGAELYVNLEPCAYYGKTPPCADLLVASKIAKVHVAMVDPNPKMNGTGIQKLRSSGIEAEVGLLSDEAARLNEAFARFTTSGLPFVTLKVAASLDGRIALANGRSKYITCDESLKRTHLIRAEHDAILVGAGTVKADNPSLTVRLAEGRSPVRIIIDGKVTVSPASKIFHDNETRVILFYANNPGRKAAAALVKLEKLGADTRALRADNRGRVAIASLLKAIGKLGIASLLVEGGGEVFSEFIRYRAADKMYVFIAPKILGRGKSFSDGIEFKSLAQSLRLYRVESESVGEDRMISGYFKE